MTLSYMRNKRSLQPLNQRSRKAHISDVSDVDKSKILTEFS